MHLANQLHIDHLVQDYSISIADALEILQSCTKPSICSQEAKPILPRRGSLQDTVRYDSEEETTVFERRHFSAPSTPSKQSRWFILEEYRKRKQAAKAIQNVLKVFILPSCYNRVNWLQEIRETPHSSLVRVVQVSSLFRTTAKKASKLRITNPLWGESTSNQWNPLTKGQ